MNYNKLMNFDKHDRSVILFSGGMDSFIGWCSLVNAGNNPKPLYFNLGHRYAQKEVAAIYTLMQATKQIFSIGSEGVNRKLDVSIMNNLQLGNWEEEDATIPMRNLFLTAAAAVYGDIIYIVSQKGEQEFPDRKSSFFKIASLMFGELMSKPIRIIPWGENLTKGELVKHYLDIGGDPNVLQMTVGCFSNKESYPKHCGACPACFRRWVAFVNNDIEPDYYEKNMLDWEGIDAYKKRCKEGYYIPERIAEIKSALIKKGMKVDF